MRIRKRQVSFPALSSSSSSSLSPATFSDPLLLHPSPPPVVVQLHDGHHTNIDLTNIITPTTNPPQNLNQSADDDRRVNQLIPLAHHVVDHADPPPAPPQPSDQPKTPFTIANRSNKDEKADCLGFVEEGSKEMDKGVGEELQIQEQQLKGNDAGRKGAAFLTAELSSSTTQGVVIGKWYYEGEKVVPLKKRSRSGHSFSCNNKDSNEALITITEKDDEGKKKTMKNKKFIVDDDDQVLIQNDSSSTKRQEVIVVPKMKRGGVKSSRGGGTVVEGSRCSRVNGRGWRCYQQTLVGYSLCEHHLGKGRLRSMTSFRSRKSAPPKKQQPLMISPNSASRSINDEKDEVDDEVEVEEEKDDDDDDYEDESMKRSVRLGGVVKARSMSSLLGQTK